MARRVRRAFPVGSHVPIFSADAAARRRQSGGASSLAETVRDLWPYIWPADRADLKARALGALGLLLIAKLITMAVPYAFKWATDALAGNKD